MCTRNKKEERKRIAFGETIMAHYKPTLQIYIYGNHTGPLFSQTIGNITILRLLEFTAFWISPYEPRERNNNQYIINNNYPTSFTNLNTKICLDIKR